MTPKIGDSTIAGAVNRVMINDNAESLTPKGTVNAGSAG